MVQDKADCHQDLTDAEVEGRHGHGDLELSEPLTKTIYVQEYFQYRRPDLAGDPSLRPRYTGLKRRHTLPGLRQDVTRLVGVQCRRASPDRLEGSITDKTFNHVITSNGKMADTSQQPLQQATQPVDNPRRFGRNVSDVSEDDATDVICLLHPNSPAAFDAVRATMLHRPEHILQNDDLDGITEEDLLFNPELQTPREFALRMSSELKRPHEGFRFGRNPELCDVLLTNNQHDKLISNVHFKIFVNNQGSLMLQDLSTNGTIVDDEHLRAKDRRGLKAPEKSAMRVLKSGAIICVLVGEAQQEIKLMVRLPNRGDNEKIYEEKLKAHLSKHGAVTNFSSMRENAYGNHWTGGTLYNFTGNLGKGAFATVYKLQTKNDGTVYAAKELDKRRFIKNGHLDTKFDSELQIMKDLKHPNIVEYIDCHSHSHWIYIIMEYVTFGELSKELQERKSLPEPEVRSIAKQVIRALDYLHKRDITHRDIKPDNILISSREPLVVKLSDFGLSKCVNNQDTFLKTFCGTLLYCAPEVYPDYNNYTQGTVKRRRYGEPAPKTSPYDQSVDMWSLGAVLFHLLCGKPPIMGRGDDRGAQMLSNIMTKEVEFQPLRAQGVSDEGVNLIGRLLNRNPLLRPKEKECFNHPWLRGIPDLFEYEDDINIPKVTMQRDLDPVEELDEDAFEEEMMQDLKHLTQHPASSNPPTSSSPQRPIKRPRTNLDSITVPGEVAYPILPQDAGPLPIQGPTNTTPRLFGEISPSLLESSGLFGRPGIRPIPNDEPDIRNRIEQVSVNDYATFSDPDSHQSTDVSGRPMQYPNALQSPSRPIGSASSLLGAEAQIEQLQVASPTEAAPSDAATPDTTHPITPRTREFSPSSSLSRRSDKDPTSLGPSHDIEFSRRIDVNLLQDEAAYAAHVQARAASRMEHQRLRAETFGARPYTATELAKTIDTQTGRGVQTLGSNGKPNYFSRTINIPRLEPLPGSEYPLAYYGILTPVPGSFGENQVIYLSGRMTNWGRGEGNVVQYPDRKDVRIPKYAIKMTFWAPGVEKHVANGGDWTQFSGIRTLIHTGATMAIFVNGCKLRKESEAGDAVLYGEVHTGDIITVYQGSDPNEFLRYRVEILFGDGARRRAVKEQPFHILQETKYHRQAKARESIMQSSSVGSDGGSVQEQISASAS